MEEQKHIMLFRGAIILTTVALAAILRVLPHPWNLTPIGAMALFSGAMFRNRWVAFLLPLASLFAGDLFVGFHKLMFVVYASFAVSIAVGRWLAQTRSLSRIGGAVLLGALQFFVVTNFAMWAIGGFYPRTSTGLAACFAAAIPFFWNTLAGDALYAGILFGGFRLAEKIFMSVQERSVEANP